MKNLQNESQQQKDVPCFSIPHFNDLIMARADAWNDLDDQAIDTFASCGFDFIVASTECQYPLAASVAILTQLAYSEESMKVLGEKGEVTMSCKLDASAPIHTTFLILPEGSNDRHLQIVIAAEVAYVVLPWFFDWEYDLNNTYWLRKKIFADITEGLPMHPQK